MRTYEGGDSDSVKQNENSSLLEGVTEASLISFAGSSREREMIVEGEMVKSRCLFSFVHPGTGLRPPGVGVSVG